MPARKAPNGAGSVYRRESTGCLRFRGLALESAILMFHLSAYAARPYAVRPHIEIVPGQGVSLSAFGSVLWTGQQWRIKRYPSFCAVAVKCPHAGALSTKHRPLVITSVLWCIFMPLRTVRNNPFWLRSDAEYPAPLGMNLIGTEPTSAMPIFINVRVVLVVIMTAFALTAWYTMHVFFVSNRFKMFGVAAMPYTAKMIEFKAVRDWTNEYFVNEAMRSHGPLLPEDCRCRRHCISPVRERTSPQPTPVGGDFNFLAQPLVQVGVHVRSH